MECFKELVWFGGRQVGRQVVYIGNGCDTYVPNYPLERDTKCTQKFG